MQQRKTRPPSLSFTCFTTGLLRSTGCLATVARGRVHPRLPRLLYYLSKPVTPTRGREGVRRRARALVCAEQVRRHPAVHGALVHADGEVSLEHHAPRHCVLGGLGAREGELVLQQAYVRRALPPAVSRRPALQSFRYMNMYRPKEPNNYPKRHRRSPAMPLPSYPSIPNPSLLSPSWPNTSYPLACPVDRCMCP